MVVGTLVLAGCDDVSKNDKNYNYFGFSDGECKKILFTCAQNEAPFSNSVGCGCKITGQINTNDQERSLDYLIKRYFREKLISPVYGGHVAIDFARIGSDDSGKILKYDVLGLAEEYYLNNGKIAYGAKADGIIQLSIEETNRNYIIRSYTLFDPNNISADQKKLLTAETQKWMETKADLDSTRKKIQIAVKQDAAISFGLTMNDFVDSPAPVKAGTQQGTQQSVATKKAGAKQ